MTYWEYIETFPNQLHTMPFHDKYFAYEVWMALSDCSSKRFHQYIKRNQHKWN